MTGMTPSNNDDETRRWAQFGEYLGGHRKALRISTQAAARAAGLSDTTWRHLEDGKKIADGTEVLPQPSDEMLIGAAKALRRPVEEVFEAAGRSLHVDPDKTVALSEMNAGDLEIVDEAARTLQSFSEWATALPDGFMAKIALLDESERARVDGFIDSLVGDEYERYLSGDPTLAKRVDEASSHFRERLEALSRAVKERVESDDDIRFRLDLAREREDAGDSDG